MNILHVITTINKRGSLDALGNPKYRLGADDLLIIVIGVATAILTLGSYFSAHIILYPLTYIFAFILSPYRFWTTFTLVSLALFVRFLGGYLIPNIIIFDDEIGYARMGIGVLEALQSGVTSPWSYNPWGNVTGVLYYLFGSSPHVVKALNSSLSVITAFMLCRIAYSLYEGRRVMRLVLYFSLFMPPLIFISSIALKEQLIAFLLVATLYGILKHSDRGWIIAILALGLLMTFRNTFGIVIIVLVGLYWAIRRGAMDSTRVRWIGLLLGFGIIIAIGVATVQSELIKESKLVMFLSAEDTRGYETVRQSEAQFNQYLDLNDLFSIKNLLLIPIRSIYSPSPFRVIKSPSIGVYLEAVALTLFWYLTLPYVIIGILNSKSSLDRGLVGGFFLAVFLIASYSVLTFADDTFRYRWPALPIYFMLAAHGWYNKFHRWSQLIIWGWWISVIVFGIVYLW